MSFLDERATSFGSAVGGDLNAQIESAKTEGQQIAAAVALWGLIVAAELGVLIYFAAQKPK